LQPLIRRPAAQSPAAFRVLALFAPFAGNTPTEYLLTSPAYDANTLAVFDGSNYDIDMLRQNADVVFNQISDADQAQALLTPVAELIDRLGLPTVNPPDKIRQTAREIITRRLKDIPGCRLPKVLPADISSITALEAAATFAMPVLARPAGTHGGDDFEKFGNLSEVARFVQHHPGVEHYLIEYLDYPLGGRSFPQIPLHLRRRRDPALSSRHRHRLEAAPRQYRHDQPRLDAARGRGFSHRSMGSFRSQPLRRAARDPQHRRP
jgi:hypothetical protein